MYSGVAIENCFKFVNRKLDPKSIILRLLMQLPSEVGLSSRLLRLSRIFSVLRSECTILCEPSNIRALQISIVRYLSSFGFSRNLSKRALQEMVYDRSSVIPLSPFRSYRQLPRDYSQSSQNSQVSTGLISYAISLQMLLMPICLENSQRGLPSEVKKKLPNQIYLRWVWCGFLLRICFIASLRLVFRWMPSHTRLNPPRPSKLILTHPLGNLSPNFANSSSVRSFLQSYYVSWG